MTPEARAREHREILERTRDLWEPLRGERVFVTGGTGFVGTWLMEAFVAANDALALGAEAVLLTRDPARVAAAHPHLAAHPAIAYVRGDQTSFAPPEGTFAFVIHAATERSFAADRERPYGLLEADFHATRRVLDFARDHGTRRLLFTSSGAVYGKQPPSVAQVAETDPFAPDVTQASAAYGESKRVSEYACMSYARVAPFDAIVARLFAFVGPYLPLDEGFAVGNFIGDVLAGRPIAIGGDGTPLRSYLYAADLAVWLWILLFRGAPGQAYNVGSPESVDIRSLAERVSATLGGTVPVTVALAPTPGAPPSRYVPATARAEEELGLRPWTPLDEGIRRTHASYDHARKMISVS